MVITWKMKLNIENACVTGMRQLCFREEEYEETVNIEIDVYKDNYIAKNQIAVKLSS